MIHIRIDESVLKEYKHICIELDLSGPKQIVNMIENFNQSQNENLKIKRKLNKIKQIEMKE